MYNPAHFVLLKRNSHEQFLFLAKAASRSLKNKRQPMLLNVPSPPSWLQELHDFHLLPKRPECCRIAWKMDRLHTKEQQPPGETQPAQRHLHGACCCRAHASPHGQLANGPGCHSGHCSRKLLFYPRERLSASTAFPRKLSMQSWHSWFNSYLFLRGASNAGTFWALMLALKFRGFIQVILNLLC